MAEAKGATGQGLEREGRLFVKKSRLCLESRREIVA